MTRRVNNPPRGGYTQLEGESDETLLSLRERGELFVKYGSASWMIRAMRAANNGLPCGNMQVLQKKGRIYKKAPG